MYSYVTFSFSVFSDKISNAVILEFELLREKKLGNVLMYAQGNREIILCVEETW